MIDLAEIKAELRITDTAEDDRLTDLRDEAIYDLQQFSSKTLVEEVTDSATERTLTPLDRRYVFLYLRVHYDGQHDLMESLSHTLEKVRNQ